MSLLAVALLSVVLLAASVTDLRHRIVPNKLTFAAALVGLVLALAGGTGAVFLALGSSLALSLPLLAISLARPDGLGMGDVKLVAVIGLFAGWSAWPALLLSLLLACVGGFLISLGSRRRLSGVALPLAPFLAAGTVPVIIFSL